MAFFGCARCVENGVAEKQTSGERRYSMGVYAGRYCDQCWHNEVGPGYRDYDDPSVTFDPADAGESMDADE